MDLKNNHYMILKKESYLHELIWQHELKVSSTSMVTYESHIGVEYSNSVSAVAVLLNVLADSLLY